MIRCSVVTADERWNLHMSQQTGTVACVCNNVFSSADAPNMVTGGVSGRATLTNNLFVSRRST
ncbi:hypothetical protein WBG99_16390 [Streptomyces sp. TG1A-60]|uniref:hypothetical protein n=1 Tax=Streptomyces sp. TG1A-60 TaxID=3129111 RepID=UPI0030CACBD8